MMNNEFLIPDPSNDSAGGPPSSVPAPPARGPAPPGLSAPVEADGDLSDAGGRLEVCAVVASTRGVMQAAFTACDLRMVTDRDLLAVMADAYRLIAQVQALTSKVVAEVAGRQACEAEARISTAQWLHLHTSAHTLGIFRGQVAHAKRLHGEFGDVAAAQARGEVSADQARAIVGALKSLPPHLDPGLRDQATATMVELAATLNPHDLAKAGNRLIEVIDPDWADELLAKKLEREAKKAEQDRHFSMYPDHHGSWIIKGKIPTVVGEQLFQIIDAIASKACADAKAAKQTGDPGADVTDIGTNAVTDMGRARADALTEIITAYTTSAAAPTHGGDRPRISVLIDWDALRTGLGAGTTETGIDIPAQDVRHLACDADLIPAVLNSDKIPLDVGRQHRLVPAWLRTALSIRDRGCAFPGCDRPPRHCDAHHILPWWCWGDTSLTNTVLLCPSHHATVEPATTNDGRVIENHHRWEVQLNPAGIPEFLPPAGPHTPRTPITHTRYRHQKAA